MHMHTYIHTHTLTEMHTYIPPDVYAHIDTFTYTISDVHMEADWKFHIHTARQQHAKVRLIYMSQQFLDLYIFGT